MTAINLFDERAFLDFVAAESHEWEDGWEEELRRVFAQMQEKLGSEELQKQRRAEYARQYRDDLLKSGRAAEAIRAFACSSDDERRAYAQAFLEREYQLCREAGFRDANEVTLACLAQSDLPLSLKAFLAGMCAGARLTSPLN
jgi:hypothetical protein